MICNKCKDKPILRGIKIVKCVKCNKDTAISYAYSNICNKCSDTHMICQCCGKEIEKEISHYHLSWLQFAIENFKNQNGISHMIDVSMKMGVWTQYLT